MTHDPAKTTNEWVRQVNKDVAVLKRRPNHGPSIAVLQAARSGRNLLTNARFRANQRSITTGLGVPAREYGFDLWQASGYQNLLFNPTGAGAGAAAYTSYTTGTAATGAIAGATETIPGITHQGTVIQSTPANATADGLYLNGNTAAAGAVASTNLPRVKPGRTYTWIGWVKTSSIKSLRLVVTPYNSALIALTALTASPTVVTVANTYTLMVFSFTIPAEGWYVTIFLNLASGTWNGTDTLRVGAMMLLEGTWTSSNYPTYFDGVVSGRWQGTANLSPSYSLATDPGMAFTSAPNGQQVTLSSGSEWRQTIERANVEAGTYIIAWEGTATARVYNATTLLASRPAYASSGFTVELDGTDDVVVEFTASGGTKTLYKAQLEIGTTATLFEETSVRDELARCRRYFRRYPGGVGLGGGIASTTTIMWLNVAFEEPMRIAPYPIVSGTMRITDSFTSSPTQVLATSSTSMSTGVSLNRISSVYGGTVALGFAGLTQGRAYWPLLQSGDTPALIDFDAGF